MVRMHAISVMEQWIAFNMIHHLVLSNIFFFFIFRARPSSCCDLRALVRLCPRPRSIDNGETYLEHRTCPTVIVSVVSAGHKKRVANLPWGWRAANVFYTAALTVTRWKNCHFQACLSSSRCWVSIRISTPTWKHFFFLIIPRFVQNVLNKLGHTGARALCLSLSLVCHHLLDQLQQPYLVLIKRYLSNCLHRQKQQLTFDDEAN